MGGSATEGKCTALLARILEYRGAPEQTAIQAISWFWAVMLVVRLLCSIQPPALADRKLIVGAMLSGTAALLLLAGRTLAAWRNPKKKSRIAD